MTQPLSQGLDGVDYRVVGCAADARTRSKLETLGLVLGSTLTVISNTKAGLILDVRGSRLAIGYSLAKQIDTQPIERIGSD
jgi:ferrous iron transport protein A